MVKVIFGLAVLRARMFSHYHRKQRAEHDNGHSHSINHDLPSTLQNLPHLPNNISSTRIDYSTQLRSLPQVSLQ